MTAKLFAAQTALIQAAAAFYTAEQARLSDEAASTAALCGVAAVVCTELAGQTPANNSTYSQREQSLLAIAQQYQAAQTERLETRLSDLQFNGVAIDLELVRFYLFGHEVIAAPKV